MKKRILITGATGLLGMPLTTFLKKKGYSVFTHGINQPADYSGDLREPQFCKKIIEESSPDILINLVALTNVDQCEENCQLAYEINALSIRNLQQILLQRKSCVLIQISTDQVYDGPGAKIESNITLRNYYTYSKYCGELLARQVPSIVLRTNFFGKADHPTRKSFSDWILADLKNRSPIQLFDDIFFSPLKIATLCEMIGIIIENPTTGTYNVGSSGSISKASFGLALANTFGLSLENVKVLPTSTFKTPRPKNMTMDSKLFEQTFGVRMPHILDEISDLRRDYGKQI